ncbi:hypothetical protein GJU40_11700 [Bacillus lacus]|uniref:Uncharacterized protein n=1 Tax=Metabacillus lacus TaxID=1983721 RepID=A0A7X2IZR9_9BACI|nr:hypothetical protein [Metabacillus lacus]MRX72810.1 hypothetical protein [Metabacillus lacus]
MNKILTIVITLLILICLSFGIATYFDANFSDYSFFVGLVVTVVIWFSNSKGGATSRLLDVTVQGGTGIKSKQEKFEFSPGLIFLTCLAYTVVNLVALLFQYRDYL